MQIINTYKCNLQCKHCLFSCRNNRQGYLDNYILRKFLEKEIAQNDYFINYCGGEIFLHPGWEEQLSMLACAGFTEIRLVSNGFKLYSKKRDMSPTMERLINIVSKFPNTQFTLMISDDRYHREELQKRGADLDDIILSVENAIEFCDSNIYLERDFREKKINMVMPLGRALKNKIYDNDGICLLDLNNDDQIIAEITLDPYGRIYACSNARGYIGTVDTPDDVLTERLSKIKPQKSCLQCIYKGLDKIKERRENYV